MGKKKTTLYYGYKFTPDITLKIEYTGKVSPDRNDREIYRINVKFIEAKTGKWLRDLWYEIWASVEYIEDELRLSKSPDKKELAEFGFRFVEKRYKENDNELPKEFGAFLTKKHGIKLANNRGEMWKYFDDLK